MSGGDGHTNNVDVTADNGAVAALVSKPRRLEVIFDDEIFYPVVSFVHPEEVKVNILPKAEEVVSLAPAEVATENLGEIVEKVKEPKQRRISGWRLWRKRLSTFAVAIIVMIAVALVGMRLAGFKTFTVMSGSMEPDLPVGSMVYVRPVDYKSLKVGDVVSYVANDEKTVVTHRIVDIEVDKEDSSVWRFKTKGDANTTSDGSLVHYKNVLGTPVFIIPQIGYFAHNIQRPPGIYITLVVGTLLLAWTFLPSTLEERRKTARRSIV